ncbi:hypothetical protein L3Y34_000421 [Caenorhabditis briggsae]|uniref:Uncharacterized protein n=1 Tax=Caenorhabditis briggsae TaxID=6238 RepID=A0AAE9ILZ2_CAEBR|nr:hypothetical protein L3Y34_000421 [Caenorhabditis briggsae]
MEISAANWPLFATISRSMSKIGCEQLGEKSDDLLINGPEIVSHIPHKYSIDAQDTSDGVDLERKLEIYMMVHHNCTSNGKQKKLRYFWGKYNIDVWEVKESKDLELFDKGEDV